MTEREQHGNAVFIKVTVSDKQPFLINGNFAVHIEFRRGGILIPYGKGFGKFARRIDFARQYIDNGFSAALPGKSRQNHCRNFINPCAHINRRARKQYHNSVFICFRRIDNCSFLHGVKSHIHSVSTLVLEICACSRKYDIDIAYLGVIYRRARIVTVYGTSVSKCRLVNDFSSMSGGKQFGDIVWRS